MNRYMKYLTPFLLMIAIFFSISACSSSLEKPTGLEESNNDDVELNTEENLNNEELLMTENEADESVNANSSQLEESEDDTTEAEKQSTTAKKGNKNTNITQEQTSSTDKKKQSTSTSNEKVQKSSGQSTNKSTKSGSSTKTTETSSKNKQKKQEKNSAPPKEDTKSKAKKEENPKSTITHSIVISSSEVPLPATKMTIENGDTVLQALIKITMDKGIQMDYRGGQGASAYVQGMGNVYEFDRGQGSGWMYRINGVFPDRGAGVVPLCDGDVVEWLYTTDLGQDLGADLKPVRRDGKCP